MLLVNTSSLCKKALQISAVAVFSIFAISLPNSYRSFFCLFSVTVASTTVSKSAASAVELCFSTALRIVTRNFSPFLESRNVSASHALPSVVFNTASVSTAANRTASVGSYFARYNTYGAASCIMVFCAVFKASSRTL